MLTQAIPLFQDAHLLRREMLQALSDHAFMANQLLYKGYANGILSGCELTTTSDTIILNEGVIFFEGQMFLIRSPLSVEYYPTNKTMLLKVQFSEQRTDDNFIYREVDIALGDNINLGAGEIELCRFKLQEGARLRYQYQDFEDWNTEYDTLNVIHAAYSAKGESTLSPEILKAYAGEMLELEQLSELDTMFCIQVLEQERPMSKAALVAYLQRRNKVVLRERANLAIYRELAKILKVEKHGIGAGETKTVRTRWKLMVD